MTASFPKALPLVIAIAAGLAACASTPPSNMQLDAAHAAYDRAAGDNQVARNATKELQRAAVDLQNADNALNAGQEPAAVDHYAYLANQRVQLALQTDRIARADLAAKAAQDQRDQLVMQQRTRDAEARAASERQLAERRLATTQMTQMQNEALAAELADLKARQTDRGMVLTIGDVLFDSGRATLKPGAMLTIDKLAQFLQNNPERKIEIDGYTDNVGSAALNQELSERRAQSVQQALSERGITYDRVSIKGLGKDYPVASNDTAAGRQQNRRVEIVFSDNSGGIKARTSSNAY